jgi:hypothetical protein
MYDLRTIIESDPVFFSLGLLVVGFLAGIACYSFILRTAHLKVISLQRYELLTEYESEVKRRSVTSTKALYDISWWVTKYQKNLSTLEMYDALSTLASLPIKNNILFKVEMNKRTFNGYIERYVIDDNNNYYVFRRSDNHLEKVSLLEIRAISVIDIKK